MKESQEARAGIKKSKGFHLRMSEELRKRIDDARKVTGRSVNAELLARVKAGLDAGEPDLIGAIRSLKESVDELRRRLDAK